MIKGKHIMILVIILLVSLVNLAIYSYWDVPSERDWKIGTNFTVFMVLTITVEIILTALYVGYTITSNWDKWWNSEIKLPKQW